jgi:hypothetical protein
MSGNIFRVPWIVGTREMRSTTVRVWVYAMCVKVRKDSTAMMMARVVGWGNMVSDRGNMVSKVWGFGSVGTL